MFIRNCLTPLNELTSIHPDEQIETALVKMSKHLSLPCVDKNGSFVGIVSKRTVFEAFEQANPMTFTEFKQQPISQCLLRDVPTLTLNDHFEDTIAIIIKIPFVPIVDDGKLLGIVKRSAVQNALSVAFASNVDADRLFLGVPEVEGAFERLFNITHRLGLSVVTCVPFDAGENLNRRVILKVTKSPRLQELVSQLERAGMLVIQVN
ncbi:CBS domain-containing protein [Alicyclobacillus dauci]|uniref:CBS domain-containing protein n=1 Tax=Alicyclobacillus dauci TaxID=1475485 RepID=A0ABY6YYH2_9BACL|nr:CBS domain-containing protein [Alicyclobacillus dauci]WAH35482.1 CBS domain-containing protein [Alicyclobacillus dauci]